MNQTTDGSETARPFTLQFSTKVPRVLLQNYRYPGELRCGPSGPPAQVGDTVRLFLEGEGGGGPAGYQLSGNTVPTVPVMIQLPELRNDRLQFSSNGQDSPPSSGPWFWWKYALGFWLVEYWLNEELMGQWTGEDGEFETPSEANPYTPMNGVSGVLTASYSDGSGPTERYVDAKVVAPIKTTKHLVAGCAKVFTLYNFEYLLESTGGSIPLTESDVISVECISCCESLESRFDSVEQAAAESQNLIIQAKAAAEQAEAAAEQAVEVAERVLQITSSLSANGIISDTDLSLNGTTVGADQSSNIQAILDKALLHPLIVEWDVAVTAAGLKIHPNTIIKAGEGCGAKLPNAANKPILQNANCKALAAQPIQDIVLDRNIGIFGGIWHGNPTTQAHDTPEEGWNVPIRLMNVEFLKVVGVTIFRPRTFALHASNIRHFVLDDIYVDVGIVEGQNFDGIHINGPAHDGVIRGGSKRTQDDPVALNADDIDTQITPAAPSVLDPFAKGGDITRVRVQNVHFNRAEFCGIRLLSGLSRMDDIVIDGCTGSQKLNFLHIDNYNENPSALRNAGNGNFGKIVVQNCDIEFDTMSADSSYGGGIFVGAHIETLVVKSCTWKIPANFDGGVFFFRANSIPSQVCVVTNFVAEDQTVIYKSPQGLTTQGTFWARGGTIRNFYLSGFKQIDEGALATKCVIRPIISNSPVGGVGSIDRIIARGNAAPDGCGLFTGLTTSTQIDTDTVGCSFFHEGVTGANRSFIRTGNLGDRYVFTCDPTKLRYALARPDKPGGDVAFTAGVRLSNFVDSTKAYLIARSSPTGFNPQAATIRGYAIVMELAGFRIVKLDGSVETATLATRTATIFINTLYILTLQCVAGQISAYCHEPIADTWLQPDGTFGVARNYFAHVSDASFASAGYCAVATRSNIAAIVTITNPRIKYLE